MRIERSWKGNLGPSRVVSVRVDDSHRRMGRAAVGQRWMLFVTKFPKALVTSDCSGSWRVTAKTPLVDAFTPRPERADSVSTRTEPAGAEPPHAVVSTLLTKRARSRVQVDEGR